MSSIPRRLDAVGHRAETQEPDTDAAETFVCEGVVTTLGEDGRPNISPMGPQVTVRDGRPDWSQLVLRPFDSSRTYRNLQRHPRGVFHITDDVSVIAAGAVGQADAQTIASDVVDVPRLADCCRWLEFEVVAAAGERPRETLRAHVVGGGELRPFAGFHRARHAVLEAAILATRTHLLSADEIASQLAVWQPLVEKTGTSREREAWDLVVAHCRRADE